MDFCLHISDSCVQQGEQRKGRLLHPPLPGHSEI
jgi:hypothetical protein